MAAKLSGPHEFCVLVPAEPATAKFGGMTEPRVANSGVLVAVATYWHIKFKKLVGLYKSYPYSYI